MTQRAGEGSTSSERKTVERERHRVERVRSIDRPDPPHLPSWLFACHVWGQGGGAGGRFLFARSLSLHALSRKPFVRRFRAPRPPRSALGSRRVSTAQLLFLSSRTCGPFDFRVAACRAFGLCSLWVFRIFRLAWTAPRPSGRVTRVSLFFLP